MKILLFALFVFLTQFSTKPVLAQTSPFRDIKSVSYAFPADWIDPWTLQTLPNNLPKIKSLGFNTVWLYMVWSKFESQALPTPIYNEDNFTKLKETLNLLKTNGIQAILPLDYLWGGGNDGGLHPQGVNSDSWLKDPVQYQAFENYVKEFLMRIADYHDMVYILLFDESTESNINPYNAEQHAALLRSTLGSLPKRLPSDLRSKFRFGFHDGTFFFNQNFSPNEQTPFSPIEKPSDFDFFSGVNYYTFLGYDQTKIIPIIDQQVTRFRQSFPDLPLIFGEFGATSCNTWLGNEDTQAIVDAALISYFLSHGYGFNLWGWLSNPPEGLCMNGNVDAGLGINNNDGNPKKVVNVLKTILNPYIENGQVNTGYTPWAVWITGKNLSQFIKAQLFDDGLRWGNDLPVTLSADNTWLSFQLTSNIPPSSCNIGKTCNIQVQLLDTRSDLISNQFSLTIPSTSPSSSPTPTNNPLSHEQLIENEINWVLNSNQLDSGAITMNGKSEGAWIVPYQASYFGIYALKTKPTVVSSIKKYIQWHFDHLNISADPDGLIGTIFDYNLSGGNLVPSYQYKSGAKMYDSVDSTAAVFFTLLRTYWDTTRDTQLLVDNKSKIDLIYSALSKVMEPDGLTQATVSWTQQYAMDNFEVNAGLYDISYLYQNVFNDSVKADSIKSIADNNKAAIEANLWNGSLYRVSKQTPYSDFSWNTWYPDSLVGMMGIVSGYLASDPTKSQQLYNQFTSHQSDWTSFSHDFPMTIQAYAAALMHDYQSVQKYDSNLQSKYSTRQWPYHTGEAAFYIAYHKILRDMSVTPSPTPIHIPGDITGKDGVPDGVVNIYDYNLLIGDFGKTNSPADIDKNGKVDIYDYNTLIGNFGRGS